MALLVALLVLSGVAWAAPGSAQLTWTDNSDNEQGFVIERKTGAAGVYAVAGKTGPNATSFADTVGLVEGETYFWRVAAFNSAGQSAYSNEATRTIPFTIPAAPSGLTAQ